MLRLIARRTGGMVLVVFVAVTAMFFLIRAAADGPLDSFAPAAAANPEARATIESRLGLDRPLFEQYTDYLQGVLTGDFGESFADGSSVAEQIADALPVSIELGLLAAGGALTLGLALGGVGGAAPGPAGRRRGPAGERPRALGAVVLARGRLRDRGRGTLPGAAPRRRRVRAVRRRPGSPTSR